jgi:site-specific recombinase XerC
MQRVHTSNAHVRNTSKSTSGPVTHTRDPRKGHEQIETTNIYLHADMTHKQRAIDKTRPLAAKPGRYRPPDSLLAFLEAL